MWTSAKAPSAVIDSNHWGGPGGSSPLLGDSKQPVSVFELLMPNTSRCQWCFSGAQETHERKTVWYLPDRHSGFLLMAFAEGSSYRVLLPTSLVPLNSTGGQKLRPWPMTTACLSTVVCSLILLCGSFRCYILSCIHMCIPSAWDVHPYLCSSHLLFHLSVS